MTFVTNFPTNSTPIPQFGQIITNWTELTNQFGVDHAPFTETIPEKKGHHKQVTLFEQLAAVPALPQGQSLIYSKDQAVGADTYRVLRFDQKPNTAAQRTLQLTDLLAATGTSTTAPKKLDYQVYDTPWGWRIHMGRMSSTTGNISGSTDFFGIAPSFLANILFASGNPFGSGGIGISVSPGGSQVNVNVGATVSQVLIFVISVA